MKRRLANGHLSGDEISALLAGLDEQGSREHAQGCEICGAELAKLQAALLLVRDGGRDWAARVATAPVWKAASAWESAPASRWVVFREAWLRPRRLALAGVLLGAMVVVPALRERQFRMESEALRVESTAQISDAALMAQVDLQVSRAVPEPMESLASLLSDRSNGTSATE